MTLRTRDLLDAVYYVAQTQDGLVSAQQLAEIGFASSSVNWRIRTGGPWKRVLPGIYTVAATELTMTRRERAGVIFGGFGSILTGVSALRRHGLKALPTEPGAGRVHVSVPIECHRKSAGFVLVERTKRQPTPVILNDLACAPVARAVVDAGRRMTSRRETRAMVLEAVQRRMTTIELLKGELRLAQRRGTALLTDVLAEAQAGVRSVPEAELRQLVLQTNIPPPLWNPVVLHPDETFLASPDALIEESMVAIEVDSREHHSEGEEWDNTLERHTEMAIAGLIVVHIIPANLRANPARQLGRISRAHRQGLNRPLPDLRVKPLDECGACSV